ncbi:MAG: hypothetical protein ACYDAO_08875 [Thermoplasmataceae archaeon]
MSIFKRQSQEEKDFNLRIKLKNLKKQAETFVTQCDRISKSFEEKAAEASNIGNRVLARNFATKSLQFELQSKRARSFILIISDMELTKEQHSMMNSLSSAMSDFVKSVGNGKMGGDWATSLSGEIDKVMDQSVRMDSYFGDFLDNFSNQALNASNLPDKELEEKMEAKQKQKSDEDVKFTDDELDKRIKEGIEKIKIAKNNDGN